MVIASRDGLTSCTGADHLKNASGLQAGRRRIQLRYKVAEVNEVTKGMKLELIKFGFRAVRFWSVTGPVYARGQQTGSFSQSVLSSQERANYLIFWVRRQ